MLQGLLKRTGAEALVFDFVSTPRNGPCADFLESLLEEKPKGATRVSASLFHKRCPPLYHRVLNAPER